MFLLSSPSGMANRADQRVARALVSDGLAVGELVPGRHGVPDPAINEVMRVIYPLHRRRRRPNGAAAEAVGAPTVVSGGTR